MPTRGLLGFRQSFLTATRGTGIVHSIFYGYEPYAGSIRSRATGSLVAWEAGISTAYALFNAQERGKMFLGPGVEIYEGMIVGRRPTEEDLTLSVTKKKHLTNHRSSTGDELVHLEAPIVMSLDDALEYIAEDELVEVTPKSFRLRKRILNSEERRKSLKTRNGNETTVSA